MLSYIRLGCRTKGCKGMKQSSVLAEAHKQCANKCQTIAGIAYKANDASSVVNANPRNEWRVRIRNSGHFCNRLDRNSNTIRVHHIRHRLELQGTTDDPLRLPII